MLKVAPIKLVHCELCWSGISYSSHMLCEASTEEEVLSVVLNLAAQWACMLSSDLTCVKHVLG